ncbi:MAG: stage V sporulation protein AA [Lachnospiraceae bacterium]
MDTVYIKASQCVLVKNERVLLKDILTIYTNNKTLTNTIGNIHLYTFDTKTGGQLTVSIMKIIELILEECPDIDIDNIGEPDFIVKYEVQGKYDKFKKNISTLFLCFVAFIGGGYAIMAYNTDIGAKELFNYLSMLFLGDAQKGALYLSVTYAIGLTIGMITFFNHLGNKRITKDPTPLEVQMRLYESDVSSTIIKDMNRNKESMDI